MFSRRKLKLLLSRSQSDNLPIASLDELPCGYMRAFQLGVDDNVPPFQYVTIVGISKKKIQFFVCLLILSKVTQLLKDIDLIHVKDTLSRNLSGGQKRKLCVGSALIGDPKV